MPVAMNFSSLKDDLRSYLERGTVDDPTVYDQLPNLINLAERRLSREVKITGTIAVVTSTMTAGMSVYAKPDRWRETISISIGTGVGNNTRKVVAPRAYEFARAIAPNPTATGEPRYYSDYNYQHWLFAPTPDAAYPYEVVYHEQPAMLDDTNETNWWTEYAPNALLYASLLEATPFLKRDERIPVWQQFYDRAIASLNGEDIRQIIDRTIVRRED
jgi:hypothetical protein